ncbi:MAG: hypothetical protein JKY50_00710 [Oleispira sp.]|nr:hypothetical protein [Oleispira sp.]
MKDTNQLLTNIVNQQATREILPAIPAQTSSQSADSDLMEKVINDLFLFLKTSYSSFKNNFKSAAEVSHAKREWSRTLIENGITSQEQIMIGKIAVRKQGGEWAPGPSDFCKMCVMPDMGIPEVTQAYYEAANAASHPKEHNWSHGIVHAAGKQTGWYLLKTEVSKITQPIFNKIYKDMSKRMLMGETFTAPEKVRTTVNRLTVDAKKEKRTKTESNKNAAAKARKGFKW